MGANFPIGIFDSGIGGLTVANAISGLLPQEHIVYFGDTAHMPYGDKSRSLIRAYATAITDFLLQEKQCKCIVIACNTASAAAYEYLRDRYAGKLPVFNVIDPIVEAVIADEQIKTIGIIATKTTIASGVYQEKFARRKPSLEVKALATPLLASMIEEGFHNNNISRAVIHNYLEQPELQGIDGLVLGCTHYPIIRDEIDQFYGGKIKLFDSTDIVAEKLRHILDREGLLNSGPEPGQHSFYVSDFTESFQKTAALFYGRKVKMEQKTGLI